MTGRPPVLADPAADAQLRTDGITGPIEVLDPDQLARLTEQLAPLIPDDVPFFAMHRPEDTLDRRRRISETVKAALAEPLGAHLAGHRLLAGAHLFAKQPADGSHLGLHQDWTFVDETRTMSGSFWVPLVDTDASNGRFHAVVGSHRIGPTYRGSPLWPYPWGPLADQLEAEFVTPFDTPAGSALAYDHSIIHGSFANRSSLPRVAVVVGFVPIDEPLHHYYLADDGRQYRYTVTDEFFLDLVIGPEPHGPHVLGREEIHVELPTLRIEDLEPLRPGRVGAGSAAPAPSDAPATSSTRPLAPSATSRRRPWSAWGRRQRNVRSSGASSS